MEIFPLADSIPNLLRKRVGHKNLINKLTISTIKKKDNFWPQRNLSPEWWLMHGETAKLHESSLDHLPTKIQKNKKEHWNYLVTSTSIILKEWYSSHPKTEKLNACDKNIQKCKPLPQSPWDCNSFRCHRFPQTPLWPNQCTMVDRRNPAQPGMYKTL